MNIKKVSKSFIFLNIEQVSEWGMIKLYLREIEFNKTIIEFLGVEYAVG